LSSKLARTAMGILVLKNSPPKSIPLSTFLKACPRGDLRPCFFLIMHQAIKNKLWMRYQHRKRQKVRLFLLFTLIVSLHQHRTKEGLDTPHGWAMYATQSAPKLPNGDAQSFYLPNDHPSMLSWFKRME
jgi:hypothetical protein